MTLRMTLGLTVALMVSSPAAWPHHSHGNYDLTQLVSMEGTVIEGLNLVIGHADGSTTYAGLYLHARRLYILEATVPAGAPPQGLFQQSLAFLDENGKQIRYELDTEGVRTRIQ
jgi:hypothetical protein